MTHYSADTPVNSYKLAMAEKAAAENIEYKSEDLAANFQASAGYSGAGVNAYFDGDKFAGGFGATQLLTMDYWTLRERSNQLFTTNLYARGLIRRLITNEINTGLTPEVQPDEEIIGLESGSLGDWSETVENRFGLWGKDPLLCDFKHGETFGALQRAARMEAYISGDVLVVVSPSRATKLPQIRLISGSRVQSPLETSNKLRKGHEIRHGVETDALGRVAAHWVVQEGGGSKRVPAFGEKSGRRISWLVYGTEKRLDSVRGEPLLSLILQSLREVDRYRDSTQRKATINSLVAMQVTKSENLPGTLPVTGAAVRRDAVATTDSDGTPRSLNLSSYLPGIVVDEMQTGEKIELIGGHGTDTNFGEFEQSIIQAVAWANEIPPEILTLAFSNNYSASQAAINEFKIYLNKVWTHWGETFCTPIYVEWLISDVLLNKIQAPGLLEARRDRTKHDVFAAWVSVDWYGSIKPSTDVLKQAKGSVLLVENAWSTNARESRMLTGSKFMKNVKHLKRENAALVEAMRPLAEFKQEFGEEVVSDTLASVTSSAEAGTPVPSALDEVLSELLDGRG